MSNADFHAPTALNGENGNDQAYQSRQGVAINRGAQNLDSSNTRHETPSAPDTSTAPRGISAFQRAWDQHNRNLQPQTFQQGSASNPRSPSDGGTTAPSSYYHVLGAAPPADARSIASTAAGPQAPAAGYNAGEDLNTVILALRKTDLRVSHLNDMLKTLNMSRAGLKKEKQERLLFAAQHYFNSRNLDSLRYMRQVVSAFAPGGSGTPPYPPRQIQEPMTYTQAVNTIRFPSPPMPARPPPPAAASNPLVATKSSSGAAPISFNKSPFYTLEYPLSDAIFFIRPYTRRRIQQVIRFKLSHTTLINDTKRVLLMSQHFMPGTRGSRPLYFPFYVDFVLDNQEIKANTRGVRGNVGSAKPLDLTKSIGHKKSLWHSLGIAIHVSDQNHSDTISDKSFAMCLYLATKVPYDQLVAEIKRRAHFTVERTRQQLRAAADLEDGIESTAMRYSLKDSVMRTRIAQPVRSELCDHIDCFDAESFFMLQDQAETWKCPICNRKITYGSLKLDDFFSEILQNTATSVDSVEVSPDGGWSVVELDSSSESGDSDDDNERMPASKRARSEPRIEVVDLLSDTDEEVPQPVQPVPSRSRSAAEGLVSQDPRIPVANQGDLAPAPIAPPQASTPSIPMFPTSLPGHSRQLAAPSDAATGLNRVDQSKERRLQTELDPAGNRTGDPPRPPSTSGFPSLNETPQERSHSSRSPSLSGASRRPSVPSRSPSVNEAPVQASQGSGSPSLSTTPLPESTLATSTEPRRQIAQMLQAIRNANSVLFESVSPSLNYSPVWEKPLGAAAESADQAALPENSLPQEPEPAHTLAATPVPEPSTDGPVVNGSGTNPPPPFTIGLRSRKVVDDDDDNDDEDDDDLIIDLTADD